MEFRKRNKSKSAFSFILFIGYVYKECPSEKLYKITFPVKIFHILTDHIIL